MSVDCDQECPQLNALAKLLDSKDVVLADGATGTNLFAMGLAQSAPAELWCVDHPHRVRDLHQQFVDAGSDIILTNSFGSNRFRLALHGIEDRVSLLARTAAALAREVADRAERTVVVAGSIGPTGAMIGPIGERTQAQVQEAFEEQAMALKEGGADVAWIETMYSEKELVAAIAATQRAGLPYVATMTFDTNGRTMMGLTPEQAVVNIKQHVTPPLAFGANCGMGPAQLIDSLISIKCGASADDVIVAKGNAGLPKMGMDLHVHYEASPQVMADYVCLARDLGARIIGGCCGTTAQHVRAMAQALQTRPQHDPTDKETIERLLGPMRVVAQQRPQRRRRR
jgi:5-methyltetrahydrofolate--homocysteine methyltransferase